MIDWLGSDMVIQNVLSAAPGYFRTNQPDLSGAALTISPKSGSGRAKPVRNSLRRLEASFERPHGGGVKLLVSRRGRSGTGPRLWPEPWKPQLHDLAAGRSWREDRADHGPLWPPDPPLY